MTFTITADTHAGQETKKAETAAMALAWVEELRDRGAKEFYIWEYAKRRRYTINDLEELVDAERP